MLSVTISLTNNPNLELDLTADQTNPKLFYVYGHLDEYGNFFYIGKGTGRRAWSKDRHPLWLSYVSKYLRSSYSVCIIKDNLSLCQAEELESLWIYKFGESLINLDNPQSIDYEASHRYNLLQAAINKIITSARKIEKTNPDLAVRCYIKTVRVLMKRNRINYHKGLVAKVLNEEGFGTDRFGDIRIIDRLTLCLVRLMRYDFARSVADSYFSMFPGDRTSSAAEPIFRRINKKHSRRNNTYDDSINLLQLLS